MSISYLLTQLSYVTSDSEDLHEDDIFSFNSALCFRVHLQYVLSLCHCAKFEHVRFTPYDNGRKGCYCWIWIWLVPTATWDLMHAKQVIYHWATFLAIYSFLILEIIAGFGCMRLKIWRILVFFHSVKLPHFVKEQNKNKGDFHQL